MISSGMTFVMSSVVISVFCSAFSIALYSTAAQHKAYMEDNHYMSTSGGYMHKKVIM